MVSASSSLEEAQHDWSFPHTKIEPIPGLLTAATTYLDDGGNSVTTTFDGVHYLDDDYPPAYFRPITTNAEAPL